MALTALFNRFSGFTTRAQSLDGKTAEPAYFIYLPNGAAHGVPPLAGQTGFALDLAM